MVDNIPHTASMSNTVQGVNTHNLVSDLHINGLCLSSLVSREHSLTAMVGWNIIVARWSQALQHPSTHHTLRIALFMSTRSHSTDYTATNSNPTLMQASNILLMTIISTAGIRNQLASIQSSGHSEKPLSQSQNIDCCVLSRTHDRHI